MANERERKDQIERREEIIEFGKERKGDWER